jgi:dCTP deaminase
LLAGLPRSAVLPSRPSLIDSVEDAAQHRATFAGKSGLLPRQELVKLIRRGAVKASQEIEKAQLQPASLDLRLGGKAWRVRASFLPGKGRRVVDALEELKLYEINLVDGAVLERGCVYLVELQEQLRLPKNHFASANPKSSTGRIDVFTRLIADGSDAFDTVHARYDGPLYAEVSPRSFSIRVRKGSRLNQIRFRRRGGKQPNEEFFIKDGDLEKRHAEDRLIDEDAPVIRRGLTLSVDLSAEAAVHGVVGYRAKRFGGVIDLENVAGHNREDFWEEVRLAPGGALVLDPNEFYILASAERLRIPPDLAAEMVAIDPTMGEFRVHYAGFFDPGFGYSRTGHPGARGVLEVRSLEVPFLLAHRQPIGRLVFERLTAAPDALYGEIGTSNYQGQGLKLSKHFR